MAGRAADVGRGPSTAVTADAAPMQAVDRLLVEHACRDVVLRAAACVDGNDAAALAGLFAEDAVLVRPNAPPLQGRAAIRRAYEDRPKDRVTRHLVTNTRIDIETPTRARAQSYVLLWTGSAADAGGSSGRPAHARQCVGEFDDRLTRAADGRWMIERRDARFTLYRDG